MKFSKKISFVVLLLSMAFFYSLGWEDTVAAFTHDSKYDDAPVSNPNKQEEKKSATTKKTKKTTTTNKKDKSTKQPTKTTVTVGDGGTVVQSQSQKMHPQAEYLITAWQLNGDRSELGIKYVDRNGRSDVISSDTTIDEFPDSIGYVVSTLPLPLQFMLPEGYIKVDVWDDAENCEIMDDGTLQSLPHNGYAGKMARRGVNALIQTGGTMTVWLKR